MPTDRDPRTFLLRPSALDPYRKLLAWGLIAGGGAVGAYELGQHILAGPGAVAIHHTIDSQGLPPLQLTLEAPPRGGTAVVGGFRLAPPYDVVDPDPPDPLVFHVWIKPDGLA